MSTPFDNNEKFKALSPEAQQIVVQKFQSLSPEAQKIVSSKMQPTEPSTMDKVKSTLNSISPELTNPVNMIPGVAAARLGQAGLNKVNEGYDLMGNMANEALSSKGHTTLGPAVGGVIQNIPAGVMAADAIANVGELAGTVKGVGEAVKSGSKAAIERLKGLADTIMGPGEKSASLTAKQMVDPAQQAVAELSTSLKGASNPTPELMNTQEAQAGLKTKFDTTRETLEGLRKESGAKIGALEQGAGLQFKELPDTAKAILNDPIQLGKRAAAMGRVADQGADQLSQKMPLDVLQTNRKFAESALKRSDLSNATRVNLAKSKAVFENAIDNSVPGFKEQLNSFRVIDQQLKALPQQMKSEANELRLSARKQMNDIRSGKMKTQAELKIAQQNLDNTNQQAQDLIQKGMKRDIVRGALVKGAAAATGTGYIGKKLGLF